MNTMTYKITNPEIFNAKVSRIYIDINYLWHGQILIITKSGDEISWDGQHGPNDYEDEYGFVLIEN